MRFGLLPVSCSGSDPVNAWFTPGRLAFLICLFILGTYPEVVLGSHTFFYRDAGLFGYPLAYYHRFCFWRGEIPLWNPLSNCGLPYLAQWNTMVFYPLSLIYLLFPLPWSLNFFCLGHLVLAGLGLYFLVNHWIANRFAASLAGLAYALNGLNLHSLMWPNNIAALAWMPWVVLLVERGWQQGGRGIMAAALVAATQLLAGAPEIILFTWIVIGAIALEHFWKGNVPRPALLRRFLLIGAIVTGLTALQTFPFLDLLLHSHRDRAFASEAWAMPAWGWANLLVPLFRMSPSQLGVFSQDEQEWTSSYYVAIGVAALAVLALRHARQPRVWVLAMIAGLGLVLALGKNGSVYDWLQRVVPLLGFVRFPIKFVVLTIFALPLLAAFAIGWLHQPAPPKTLRASRSLLAMAIVLLLGISIILAVAYGSPLPRQSWSATWKSGASRALFLMLTLGGVFLMAQARTVRARWLIGVATLTVVGLDAVTHTPRQNPTVITQAYEPLPINMTFIPRHGESRAMIHPELQHHLGHVWNPIALKYYFAIRRSLFADCNLLEDIPKINGFYSLYLREEAQLRALLYDHTNEFPEPLADFLAVSQISAPDVMGRWNERTNFLPFATAGQKPIFTAPSETLKALSAPDFDPRRVVYLPLEARDTLKVSHASDAQVVSRRVSSHKVQLDVKCAEPALVVVAQAYYHNWKASLDGASTRLWRANHAFQALAVPAGRHHVELVYEDRRFQIGAVISAVTLLGIVSGSFVRRKPRSNVPLRTWG